MEVYIVQFETGEYEDRTENIVAIFSKKEKADAFLVEKTALLEKLGLNAEGNNSKSEDFVYRSKVEDQIGFHICYHGGSYKVYGPFKVQ